MRLKMKDRPDADRRGFRPENRPVRPDGSAPLVQLSRDLSVAAKKGTSLAG
jgi:hypothetical protein